VSFKKLEKNKNSVDKNNLIIDKLDFLNKWKTFEKYLKLENFFEENFSDSKILQKNFSEKFKILFHKNERLWKKFSGLKFLNYLFKIKKIFYKKNENILDKKINFNNISKNLLDLNLKDFEDNILKFENIDFEKNNLDKNFFELNIYTENEKKYLEITNCDLVFDFWENREVFEITLQTDEFIKMIS
jgi:hypothetical protein